MLPAFLKMPNPQIHFFTDPFSTTFNIYSQVGLVTLVGLISKNGILIVEFANKLQEAGKSKIEAVKEASMTRLRPILMTSIATIAGHFPLTYVSGPGAAARNSIGRTLVTGMAVGTFFTLFFVPVIYLLIARDHRKEAEQRAADEGLGGGGRLSPAPAGTGALRETGGRRSASSARHHRSVGQGLPPWEPTDRPGLNGSWTLRNRAAPGRSRARAWCGPRPRAAPRTPCGPRPRDR